MKKSVLLGAGILATALLTGCGGSGSNNGPLSFSINDYTALENTTSIEGTWVGVTNFKSTYTYPDGVIDTDTYSKRQVFVISGDGVSYNQARCNASSATISLASVLAGDSFSIDVHDSYSVNVTLTNNNTMVGTTGSGEQAWDFVKISGNTSLGAVSLTKDAIASGYTAFALCESSNDGVDNEGYVWGSINYQVGFASSVGDASNTSSHMYLSVNRSTEFESDDTLHIFEYGDVYSSNEYLDETVGVNISQSNISSFVAEFTANSSDGTASIATDLSF